MNASDSPLISVVVATRDRGESVVDAARSILCCDYPRFEILIVDQSEDDRCERAVRNELDDPRVHYQRLRSQGVARARNAGIAEARGELIAITDDDCTVPTQWLSELVAALSEASGIGVVFGNVIAAEHDRNRGFIPSYVRDAPALLRSVGEKHQADGISACMGFPKRVWDALGGFDEMLGVGARLKANSEGDFAFRALRRGVFVYETPRFETLHYGFRTWSDGAGLIDRYWYGTGAMYSKHLKVAPWSTSQLMLSLAWRFFFGTSRVAESLGTDSRKSQRLGAFLRGFAAGAATPVDRPLAHFRDPGDGPQSGKTAALR